MSRVVHCIDETHNTINKTQHATAETQSSSFAQLYAKQLELGHRLAAMVKEVCVGTKTKFKEDPLTWGVTRNDDPRMAPTIR